MMKKGLIITLMSFIMLFCFVGVSFANVDNGTGTNDFVELFMGFDESTYGTWTTTGTAFGIGPHTGPNPVHIGAGMVTSAVGGDLRTGTLTSPPFTINKKFINFLIGAGNHPNQTCVNLIIDKQVVCTATGMNSGNLNWKNWNVSNWIGKVAQIQIVDSYTDPDWGHIDVDQIIFSDTEVHIALDSKQSQNTAAIEGPFKLFGNTSLRYMKTHNNGENQKDQSQYLLADVLGNFKFNNNWSATFESEIYYYYANQLRYEGAPKTTDYLLERLAFQGKIGPANMILGKMKYTPGMGLAFSNETTGAWLNLPKVLNATLFIGDAPDDRDDGEGAGTVAGFDVLKRFGPNTSVEVIVGGNSDSFNESQDSIKYYKATLWREIDFQTKIFKNWYVGFGYAKSNCDEYNTSWRTDLYYKKMDITKPGTWDIFFKRGKLGRNTAFGASNAYVGDTGGAYGADGGNYDDWDTIFGGDIDWAYTSCNRACVVGFEYAMMKNIDMRIFYSKQERDLASNASDSVVHDRNMFGLFVNFHF